METGNMKVRQRAFWLTGTAMTLLYLRDSFAPIHFWFPIA